MQERPTRSKTAAALFALFLGWAGIHRFYLGQVGLGILYFILMFFGISFVLGLLDAIVFFTMDENAFARKYGNKEQASGYDKRSDRYNPAQQRGRPPSIPRTANSGREIQNP